MRLSRESLMREAAALDFRPDILEKVLRLTALLNAFSRHPRLSQTLALKGGTALNLFLFDLPRLSVDIDLNYIGAEDREAVNEERPEIEKEIEAVCRREVLNVQAPKPSHALTSWSLVYDSALGGRDRIKVDVNYQYRVPLWEPQRRSSIATLPFPATDVLLMDEYELAGGKLTALLARRKSRDLFDAHALLREHRLPDTLRLRQAFVLYGAMNIEDWRKIGVEDIVPATERMESELFPLLRNGSRERSTLEIVEYKARLTQECQQALAIVLPLSEPERSFLDALAERGSIEPQYLTDDASLSDKICRHPALLWKAFNVRKHRGLG